MIPSMQCFQTHPKSYNITPSKVCWDNRSAGFDYWPSIVSEVRPVEYSFIVISTYIPSLVQALNHKTSQVDCNQNDLLFFRIFRHRYHASTNNYFFFYHLLYFLLHFGMELLLYMCLLPSL